MILKQLIKSIIRKLGYDLILIKEQPNRVGSGAKLLLTSKTSVVFDVGANIGQFGQDLRGIGFKGKIFSFEPLTNAFKELNIKTMKDTLGWKAFNIALGDTDTSGEINIAGNSESSSLLNILPAHVDCAPESQYIGKEFISVRTLDSIFKDFISSGDKIWLKIDTQGYEMNVLEGAQNALPYIDFIQLEMSLVPLYENQFLFNQINDYLVKKGYLLVAIEPVFYNMETGQLLQFDGIYRKNQL